MTSLRLAFGLLTAVPMGRLPEPSRRRAAGAMLLAPVTVLPMAVVLVLAHLVASHAPTLGLLTAALVLVAEALVTRAMHLDGLADTADGLSAGYDAESSLRAMKASDIGPSGVAAVALALLVQTATLTVLLLSAGGTALAVVAWVWSRHALAWACRRGVPAAQPTGLGALVADTVDARRLVLAVLGCTGVALAVAAAADVSWWHAVVGPVAAVAITLALLRRCRRRLGGVTGDVLGAVVEAALSAALVGAAVVTAWPA